MLAPVALSAFFAGEVARLRLAQVYREASIAPRSEERRGWEFVAGYGVFLGGGRII